MITNTGWAEYSIWEHSARVRDLYRRRCQLDAEEMTCAAQAAELLQAHAQPGDTLLDVGCGSGYFFHSLKSRNIPVEYFGIDGSASLIQIGRECLKDHGLDPARLMTMRIEDLSGSVDHVLCMNTLSNIDNYHRPLERMLKVARKSVILRESIRDESSYSYVADRFLDDVELNVHVNTYARGEVAEFIERHGYSARFIEDRRSGGEAEDVIGYPHYWTFVVALKTGAAR